MSDDLFLCTKCHQLKPLTDFYPSVRIQLQHGNKYDCKKCHQLLTSARNKIHSTAHKALQRAWSQRNRKRINARQRADRARHPEKKRAWNTAYHFSHQEKENARSKANHHAHPERRNAYSLKRRTLVHGLPCTFTPAEEAFCRTYFQYACAYCGNEEGFAWTLSMDHFIPLSSPQCPGTIATNMLPACHGSDGCNNRKHTKAPEQWLVEHFGTHNAARILKKIHAYFALVAITQHASYP